MKVTQLSQYIFFLAFCAFFSCTPDPVSQPRGKYATGVFVLNEGSGTEAGSVTWHDPTTGETVQDIFGKANGGASIGIFPQSMFFWGDKAYIVASGTNLIYVVNAETFEFLDTIGGLQTPRYILPVSADVAYISQWGKNGMGSLAKVDLKSNKIIGTVSTGPGPERMFLLDAQTLLVANSGGFDFADSTVSIINLFSLQEQERRIIADKHPVGFINPAFGDKHPMVLCKGDWDNDDDTNGWLGGLSPNRANGYTVVKYADDLAASDGGNQVWFAGEGSIWNLNVTGVRKAFDQAAYSLAVDPNSGNIYCGDAGSFTTPGKVVIVDHSGAKIGEFPTGIIPGDIIIR